MRHWVKANPDKVWRRRPANREKAALSQRKHTLKVRFRLTLEAYDQMLAAQEGRCANPGCRTDVPGGHGRYFVVDHDRACCPGAGSCGKCIRGLLCQPCNTAIGFLKDNQSALLGAVSYLNAARVNPARTL
jgi:hypothetical protein